MDNQSKWAVALVGLSGIVLSGVLAWRLIASLGPRVQTTPYEETFESAGSWTVGDDASATASVKNGVFEMFVELSGDIFWVTAGRHFADGIYEVEATPLEGTLDNGYGMLFRLDEEDQEFYVFKVSSDGYVFAGRCRESCAQAEALIERDWFASPAVKQGLEETNRLRVIAAGSLLTFYVNDSEVGQTSDDAFKAGDVGLMAETFAPGGLRVAFDNFKVLPLEES